MKNNLYSKTRNFLLFFILFTLNISYSFAQGPPYFSATIDNEVCNSQATAAATIGCTNTSPLFWDNNFYAISPNSQVKIVRLNFVFLQRNDGTGNFSETNPDDQQMITDIIAQMNVKMTNLNIASCGGVNSHSKIQFEVNRIYIRDEYLWNNDNDQNGYKCPDRVNWYLKNKAVEIDNDPTIPKGIDVFFTDGLTAYTANVINNSSTYQGVHYACSMIPSYNFDDGSYVHMPDSYIKCFWMKNWATIQYGQPWIPVVYSWFVGGMAGTLIHELGHSFDLTHELTCANHNIMDPSGSNSSLHDYLSDIQLSRIHRTLAVTNVRKFVKCNATLDAPLVITQNTLFDFNLKLYRKIIVNAGKVLTINCKLLMPDYASIVIMPGGRINVDGGMITNSCKQHMWGGIEVWGNSTANQFPIGGAYQQGYLDLNNATLENAITAVDLWKPNDYSKTGGIVRANHSTFRNNTTAVHALIYTNHYPNGTEADYAANFNYCNFDLDQNYLATNTFFKHIDLSYLKGVKFNACNFNLTPGVTGVSEWNQAIAAYSAGFNVSAVCASQTLPCSAYDSCTFNGFKFGIYTSRISNTTRTFNVSRAKFTNNTYGVYVLGVTNQTVLNSRFLVGNNQASCNNAQGYGIYFENSTGFAIEENTFTKTTGAPQANYFGVQIHNTNAADEVYRNTFNGLSYGNYGTGHNWDVTNTYHGLEWLCNTNNSNYADFYVPGINDGVQSFQGDINLAAGNTFSPSGATWSFYNGGGYPINYYYCATCPNQYPVIVNDQHVNRIPVSSTPTCPSHYGGGISPKDIVLNQQQKLIKEQEYASNLINYNSVKTLYDNLKDGGSTETRTAEIATAQPSDMWTLRAKLLGESPHLSMEVLKEAADKTDVFTESALFDILAANPDELKKEELIKYLEDKDNPLPGYMIDILRQVATGMTYKTALQRQMSIYNQNKTRVSNDMIRSILNDTVPDINGLRAWFDNRGGMSADKQIISSYLEEGNYGAALALANTLPEFYHLKGDDITEHGYYMEMLNLMIILAQERRTTADLKGSERETVSMIAANSRNDAGAEAKSILEANFGQHFVNCPELEGAAAYKSGGANLNALSQVYNVGITVKPNPAKEWAAFDYTLPGDESTATITITDASGKNVETLEINGKQGQKLWDTRKIYSGVYLYTMKVDGFTKTGKIVISK
jgi:hypothetical protein